MKVSVITLGCKVNQYESQAMETLLKERGHEPVSAGEKADAYIINTCTVTAESSRKSRQAARQAIADNPKAIIAVCGCWSQISPQEAAELGAHLVSGSGDRKAFLDDLEEIYNSRIKKVSADEPKKRRKFERLPAGTLLGRTRGMLKIQDGCENFCTYCIIPYARGPIRSLPAAEAVSEAERLAAEGIKELVVTGIEISSYGKDLGDGSSLESLIVSLDRAVPGLRLRLGSLEPRIITSEFCSALAELEGLCPHFHLSLQSGCDQTLKRMGRKYDTRLFYDALCLLREHFPDCGITADLIVGFPGESDAEFSQTLAFIEKCAFSSMHIFPYSRRPGTPAASMPEQLTRAVKKERARRASKLAAKMKEEYLNSCTGTIQSVLLKLKTGDKYRIPGNYCRVQVATPGLGNIIKDVRITGTRNGMLIGTVI